MIRLCFLLLCAVLRVVAHAQTVTVGSGTTVVRWLDGAAHTTVAAPLVYGFIGDAPDPAWAGKVVLLDRGTISFAQKATNVQGAGGIACIIANNTPGTGPFAATLGAGVTSTLPVVTASQDDGALLRGKTGQVAIVGTPPAVALPSPLGQRGKLVQSDGLGWVLTDQFPPTIAMKAEVKAGSAVNFAATADGTAPLSFQWIKDGANIPNAQAAAYSIGNAQPEHAGVYICQVSNAAGSTTSSTYTLAISP